MQLTAIDKFDEVDPMQMWQRYWQILANLNTNSPMFSQWFECILQSVMKFEIADSEARILFYRKRSGVRHSRLIRMFHICGSKSSSSPKANKNTNLRVNCKTMSLHTDSTKTSLQSPTTFKTRWKKRHAESQKMPRLSWFAHVRAVKTTLFPSLRFDSRQFPTRADVYVDAYVLRHV